MWISGQQKRPAVSEPGQTGTVAVGGEQLMVHLEGDLSPVVFGPAGYRWTPAVGDRVLVIKNPGEQPCVVGTAQNSTPKSVTIGAETLNLTGRILINGVPLEELLRNAGR